MDECCPWCGEHLGHEAGTIGYETELEGHIMECPIYLRENG